MLELLPATAAAAMGAGASLSVGRAFVWESEGGGEEQFGACAVATASSHGSITAPYRVSGPGHVAAATTVM